MTRYTLTPPPFEANTDSEDEFVVSTLRQDLVPSDAWGYVKPSALRDAGWTVVTPPFDPAAAPAGTVRYGQTSGAPYVKGLNQKWYWKGIVVEPEEMLARSTDASKP